MLADKTTEITVTCVAKAIWDPDPRSFYCARMCLCFLFEHACLFTLRLVQVCVSLCVCGTCLGFCTYARLGVDYTSLKVAKN